MVRREPCGHAYMVAIINSRRGVFSNPPFLRFWCTGGFETRPYALFHTSRVAHNAMDNSARTGLSMIR